MTYKMKGFGGFGNSPAKVTDSDVRGAVSKVNEGQMSFKEPGWAKVAGAIHSAAKGPLGAMMDKKGGAAPESESTPKPGAPGSVETDATIEDDVSGGEELPKGLS